MSDPLVPDSFINTMQEGVTLSQPVTGPDIYEIDVEHLGGTKFRCTAKTSDGDIPVEYPKLKNKPAHLDIDTWIAGMNEAEIKAGAIIYFDLWNFEDDSEINKTLFTKFDKAVKSFPFRPTVIPVGTLRFRTDNEYLEVYTGEEWTQFSAPTDARENMI